MLNHTYFYHGLFRKYIAIFGSLFNDIDVERVDAESNLITKLRVPLTYAPKDKMLSRLMADPEINRQGAITLPRMSFELSHPWYDADRALTATSGTYAKDPTDANKIKAIATPASYNIDFSLYVYVKNAEDGTKIIEQILPFFRPSLTVSAHLLEGIALSRDIPIILNNVVVTDTYEGNFETRRAIIWELSFTMKCYFYGPECKKPIIKFIDLNVLNPDGSLCAASNDPTTIVISTSRTQPGLTANGTPTSDVNASVSPNNIFMDDDWGVVQISQGPYFE